MISIKKLKDITYIFLTSLIIFLPSKAYASYADAKMVDTNKVWTIKFTQPVNFDKLSNDSVRITDKSNNLAHVRLFPGLLSNEVRILPPKGGYKVDEEYTLIITKQLYSTTNKQIKAEKTFNFKIKESSEETVVFKNSVFDSIIRNLLHKSDYDPIFKSELNKITKLNLNYYYADDISGIENLVNLQYLNLNNSKVTNISPIKGLTSLKYLSLNNTQLTDISFLNGLTNLQVLNLGSNQLTDISPLNGLANLQELDLSDNKLSTISELGKLNNLHILALENNQLVDISALSGLINLQELYLSNNQLTNASPLKGLTNLRYLDLSNNQLIDLTSLKNSLPNCNILQD